MNGSARLAQVEPLITDWMQAWGSVLGLGVSLIAIAVTASLLIHEIREARRGRAAASRERAEAQQDRELARRDRELAARERADAQKVHARTITLIGFHLFRTSGRITAARVHVHNYGVGPAFDLDAMLEVDGQQYRLPADAVAVVPPGELRQLSGSFERAGGSLQDGEAAMIIRFTDMAGLRWERRDNGQPVRLTEEVEVMRELAKGVRRSPDG